MTRPEREPFSIRAAVDADGAVLSPAGEVDAYAAPVLLDAARAALASGHRDLTLDCQRIWFLDSAGLRAVGMLREEMVAGGGALRLTNIPELVAAVLRIAALDHLMA
jgi:anti-sigma B factor antagonist